MSLGASLVGSRGPSRLQRKNYGSFVGLAMPGHVETSHIKERKTSLTPPPRRAEGTCDKHLCNTHGGNGLCGTFSPPGFPGIYLLCHIVAECAPRGHYVHKPTLKRIFSFHFQFPFLLCCFRGRSLLMFISYLLMLQFPFHLYKNISLFSF